MFDSLNRTETNSTFLMRTLYLKMANKPTKAVQWANSVIFNVHYKYTNENILLSQPNGIYYKLYEKHINTL